MTGSYIGCGCRIDPETHGVTQLCPQHCCEREKARAAERLRSTLALLREASASPHDLIAGPIAEEILERIEGAIAILEQQR